MKTGLEVINNIFDETTKGIETVPIVVSRSYYGTSLSFGRYTIDSELIPRMDIEKGTFSKFTLGYGQARRFDFDVPSGFEYNKEEEGFENKKKEWKENMDETEFNKIINSNLCRNILYAKLAKENNEVLFIHYAGRVDNTRLDVVPQKDIEECAKKYDEFILSKSPSENSFEGHPYRPEYSYEINTPILNVKILDKHPVTELKTMSKKTNLSQMDKDTKITHELLTAINNNSQDILELYEHFK